MLKVNVKKLRNAVKQSLLLDENSKVLLKASNGVLKVGTANSELYSEGYGCYNYQNLYDNYLSISVNCENDGSLITLVDGRDLLNTLKTIKSDYVFLSIDDLKDLVISDGKTTYNLQSYDPEFFIDERLEKDINNGIKLNYEAITNAIDSVAHATTDVPNSTILKTIGFIFQDNSLFVAGRGLNYSIVCDLKVPNQFNGRFGITKTAALSLRKIFKKNILFNIIDDGEYKIAVFKSGNTVFTTKIIKEKEYPDILGGISDLKNHIVMELKLSKNTIIDISKSLVLKTKERLKKLLSKPRLTETLKSNYYPLRLTLSNNNLNILSVRCDIGVDIPIDYTGDKYVTSLNAIDLLKVLNSICGDDVILKFIKNKHPVCIESVGKYNYSAMIY